MALTIDQPNVIECYSESGEYEWYVNLLKTFKSLKMNYEWLINNNLFKDSGHCYPRDSSIEYMDNAEWIQDYNVAIVCNSLKLTASDVRSLFKTSVNSSPKVLKLTYDNMKYIYQNQWFIPVSKLKIVKLQLIFSHSEDILEVVQNIEAFVEYLDSLKPLYEIKLCLSFEQLDHEYLIQVIISKFKDKIFSISMNWKFSDWEMQSKNDYMFEAPHSDLTL